MSRLALCAVAFVLVRPLGADDWPQWRGPDRTGISKETGLLKSWPENGPALVWKAKDLGGGFSSVSVAAGRVFSMSYRGGKGATHQDGNEVVWALDENTGKEIWTTPIGKVPQGIGSNQGPRCTPTVDGDRVYALGAGGELVCLEADTGKKKWRRNLVKDFGGVIPNWGYCESPLIEENMLIVTPGGKQGTIAALDKATGKTIWAKKDTGVEDAAQAADADAKKDPAQPQRRRRRRPEVPGVEEAGYASAIAFTVGKQRQLATFTSKGGIGVRASDGEFLWRYSKPANGTATIATPIHHDGRVFFTSDYGTGGGLVNLKPNGSAEEVYFNKDMKNHHGGVVLVNGYLYGFSSNILTCMKFDTGEVAWKDRSVGKGSLCYADGQLYVLSEDGVMGLVEATPSGYREKNRFNIPDRSAAPSWAHPVIANGRLYLRDQDTLLCYDVRQKLIDVQDK